MFQKGNKTKSQFKKGHKVYGGFQKGNKIATVLKGRKRPPYSKNWKRHMSEARKGKHYSLETEFKNGHSAPKTAFKKGHKTWNKGRKMSEEYCKKIGLSYRKTEKRLKQISELGKKQQGENNCNWNGGSSFEPYGKEFKPLRGQIRKRDNYRCQECFKHQDELFDKKGKPYKLLIHHIDFNKKNNQENNLISLCRKCHLKTNYNRKDWIIYFRNKKI